jgi:hypothetical protein
MLLFTIAVFFSGAAWAQAPACERVSLQANEADCNEGSCTLHGDVVITCEGMRMWSDHAHVLRKPNGDWGGARAWGHVVLAEDTRVTHCEEVTLAEDHIQGKIDRATVLVKSSVQPAKNGGVPQGPNAQILHGDVQRTDAQTFHVYKADFTQCDCKNIDKPSWLLKSPHISVKQGERATVWWPSFYIAPFGLKPVPLLPPLLPLSVPLKKRAMGMLSPKIAFLQAPYPQVDIPWFIPLGESWDVTLAPGYRGDWNAPRMGARVRYAPSLRVSGEWDLQYTADTRKKIASDLKHRLQASSKHRWAFASSGEFTSRLQWLSDDAYLGDFRVGVLDRVADYMPSRAQVLWRKPQYMLYAGTEYLQRLRTVDAQGAQVLSNTSAYEWGMPQRGLWVGAKMFPYHIGQRFYVDGETTWTRFGGYGAQKTTSVWVGSALSRVAYLRAWGPLRTGADVVGDAYWLSNTSAWDTSLRTNAWAEMSWVGSQKQVLHRITPRLRYASMPLHHAGALPQPLLHADHRLVRQVFHHASFELDQTWYTPTHEERARLSFVQPLDLEHGKMMQTRAEASVAWAGFQSRTWTQVRISPDAVLPKGVRALGLEGSYTHKYASLNMRYVRMASDADVFNRDLYGIGAVVLPAQWQWVHTLSAGASVFWGSRVRASYDTFLMLPRKESPKTQFAMHMASVDYVSGCNCWTAGLMAVVPGPAFLATPVRFSDVRYQIRFELLTQ